MREAKPFWKTSHQCWYVLHLGKQVRLAPDKKTATDMWHEPKASKRTPNNNVLFIDW